MSGRISAVILFFLAIWSGYSVAASFNVNPIGFDLTIERPASVLQLTNNEDKPVKVQVSSVEWDADGQEEVLRPTNPLIINPPVFSIEPKQTQYVRFGVRHLDKNPLKKEKTYRLIIEEVPNASEPVAAIKTILRISLPVFIAPNEVQRNLAWRLTQRQQQWLLSVTNRGNIHTKIQRISLNKEQSKKSIVLVEQPAYLLAGQYKVWPIEKNKIANGKVALVIQTDQGDINENLVTDIE